MNRTQIAILCALVSVCLSGVASAATYSVFALVSNAYDLNTGLTTPVVGVPSGAAPSNDIGIPNQPGGTNGTEQYQYQVDFFITASNFTAGQRGFANADIVVLLNGADGNAIPSGNNSLFANDGVTGGPHDYPGSMGAGWVADLSQVYRTNNHNTTVPLWVDDSDFWQQTDLRDIFFSIAANLAASTQDPRQYAARNLPNATTQGNMTAAGANQPYWTTVTPYTYFGSLFVDWDGIGAETLTMNFENHHDDGSPALAASYVNDADGTLQADPNAIYNGLTITFGTPEPSSIVLLVLGLLTMPGMVRRPSGATR